MVSMLMRGLLVLGLAWIAGSYLGDLHPLGDSLAVFRNFVAFALVPVALACWRWWLGKGALLLLAGLIAARAALALDLAPVEAPVVTLYQKNLLYRRADRAPLIADIAIAAPDIITFQEVSRQNLPLLETLRAAYPHQHMCEGRNVGAVAILSRWPLNPVACGAAYGMAEARVQTPAGPVRVIAVHLHWPYPYEQAEHVDLIVTALGPAQPIPTVLAGDFNMVPWAASVGRLTRAAGAEATGAVRPTWARWNVHLPIDHVFAGPEARVSREVRPLFGSDHNGVLARIAF